MTAQTTEKAFETVVESMLADGGWTVGDRGEWDADLALFPARVMSFVRGDEPELWAQMASQLGDRLETQIVGQLVRELALKGTLEVLRHGFKFYGKTFRVARFRPAHGLNPDAVQRFERNELTVTRQVRCHPAKNDTVDMVFALNGGAGGDL